MPWISANWRLQFSWNGDGPMPEEERTKLREYVARAHKHGRLVRFWATPEQPTFWKELRAAGVDLINTDKLDDLQRFLLDEAKK
jgi:glycerophosphoryl diester phosphodiesterase